MSTVIYISNKQIQVVTASGSGPNAKPKMAYTMASPEGSVINVYKRCQPGGQQFEDRR